MRITLAYPATLALVSAALLPLPTVAQPASADALTRARSHCLTAVAKVVNLPRANLRVTKEHADKSGINLEVNVPKATAPWACLADRQGSVKEVYFTGSEGAL